MHDGSRGAPIAPPPAEAPDPAQALTPFAEVARALTSAVTRAEVLERVAERALAVMAGRAAYIERIVSVNGRVRVEAALGRGAPVVGTEVPYPGSLTEEIIESAGPIALATVEEVGPATAPYLTGGCDGCAALVIPLLMEGEVLGSLVVLREPDGGAFGERDVLHGRILGDLASLSLRRVLLQEESDRERRERTAMLNSAQEGLYGIDLEGRCTFLNPAAAEMLGYAPEECLGRNMHDLVHHSRADGSPYPAEECPIHAVILTGRPVRSEEVLWRKDGSPFPAQYGAAPILDRGETLGAVVSFRDETERVRAEAERERTLAREREARAEAERAVRARDEVLGVVSHDLRNPLHTVMMSASNLLELPLEEPQRRRQVEIIKRSTERMSRLIQDLLDVARLESGSFSVELQPIDPLPVFRDACEALRPHAEKKRQAFRCACPDSLPTVVADRDRLHQVIGNLVGNAIKFTGEGGTISMRVEAGPEGVRFSVADTGPGIAPELVPHLFDPYWQARETAHLGAGLGLSITRGIVVAHGGRVWVESTPGVGSAFHFVIPAGPRPAGAPHPAR